MANNENIQTYIVGYPDFDGLNTAQRRALLLPLVDVIRAFYADPENIRKFDTWKNRPK